MHVYSTTFEALTALLLATEGLSTPFNLTPVNRGDDGYNRIAATTVAPASATLFSESMVVSGMGKFDLGYIHVWNTKGAFVYTIHEGSVRD